MKTAKDILIFLSLISFSFQADSNEFQIDLVPTYDKETSIKDTKKKKEFNDKFTSRDLVEKMGMGYDLSNTLDAFNDGVQNQGLSSETCWGNPYTTEEMIEYYKTLGFKSLRIPVTWHNHLIDDKYTIDPEWMSRVKTVVDWAIEKGFYVVLNSHHDDAAPSNNGMIAYGGGYYPLKKHRVESEKFLLNIWSQIAEAFNDGYDEHLAFESLNEPRLKGTDHEWWCDRSIDMCKEGNSVIMEYNQLVLKVVRETGGNNKKRFMVFPPMGASYDHITNLDFSLPDDKEYNTNPKVLVDLHMYTPWNFALNEDKTFNKFTNEIKNELTRDFQFVYKNYIKKGFYAIIGEMGTIDKDNLEDRLAYGKFYVENARKYNIAPFLWVITYDRNKFTWESDELVETYLKAAETPFSDNPL